MAPDIRKDILTCCRCMNQLLIIITLVKSQSAAETHQPIYFLTKCEEIKPFDTMDWFMFNLHLKYGIAAFTFLDPDRLADLRHVNFVLFDEGQGFSFE
ncbi:hypothetical protein QQP08_008584 [Theobroma cacao]|nr:hypothetical protein QQP08_008584 [Theobroma cacao]